VPDRLDVLDSTATSRLFSSPAWIYLAGRAGRVMQQDDFIDFSFKPMDVTNG
jgi:late competence protein required for DNA uptake (superfamily II DNA/RNA helicase)